MPIIEALQADPRVADVFEAHGMACMECMGVTTGSIEDGARMHGIDPEVILAELNELVAVEGSAID